MNPQITSSISCSTDCIAEGEHSTVPIPEAVPVPDAVTASGWDGDDCSVINKGKSLIGDGVDAVGVTSK